MSSQTYILNVIQRLILPMVIYRRHPQMAVVVRCTRVVKKVGKYVEREISCDKLHTGKVILDIKEAKYEAQVITSD